MSKAYRWTGLDKTGTKLVGEAHSEQDARVRAEQADCHPDHFHVEENPEYTLDDAMTDVAPEVIGQAAADALKDQDDKRVLAEANATMFHQLDELKNKNIALEAEAITLRNQERALAALQSKCHDLKAVVLAWNSERHANLQGSGAEYIEPAFMELIRALI